MKFIDVLIPLIFLSAIIDATAVDKPGAHASDRFVPMRLNANLQERGSNPKNDDSKAQICHSYDMNNDEFIVAEEIWASEAYGDPTKSIGNVRFWINAFAGNVDGRFWVNAFADNADGKLDKKECIQYLSLIANPDPKTLCDIMDFNNDLTISSDEIIKTPDALFTLVMPFNPHIVEKAEADFAIKLYDDTILGGNHNGKMDHVECKAFLSKPNENFLRGLCKLISLSGDTDILISTSELQDHFEIMEHHDVPSDLAQFVVSTFDNETHGGNNDGDLDRDECVKFFNYQHEGHD